ncbi:MAG: 2-oxoglutarate dehydrogenase E1 component [Proteobacteria bacterium]|nr:2-oxoglutarate dehydrogenase E1 component [Pseudomonadota bacterium]
MLTGENAAFLDQQYRSWLADPDSVSSELQEIFAGVGRPANGKVPGSAPRFQARSIFNAPGHGPGVAVAAIGVAEARQARVAQLINSYRVRGHMDADIDPLQRREKVVHPELTLEYYGLTADDLDVEVETSPLFGLSDRATLRDIRTRCRDAYCSSVGAEFMNIMDLEQKLFIQERLETLPDRHVLEREEELRVLRKLSDAENFERMLHTRFPGTKRFSLEGAETLIPLMDQLISQAGQRGVREIVIGMAHRGRLNVLANTLEKPVSAIVREFEDPAGPTQGSGDVKYHLGYSANAVTVHGDEVHLNLCFNPSHLEAVDPVVEGRVRAKQDRMGPGSAGMCIPVLIHGDAAFAGQGLVAEVLNLSELHGYRTGGTIHIIVNNQIGFTTAPLDARSTPYATDVARMLAIPIFHVNGEDPRAVAAAVQIAVEWRQRFHRDVVIDMYCYRKHGHNEGDEPSFTQPEMYGVIRSRPTPREVYARRMVGLGDLDQGDVDRILGESREAIEQALNVADGATVRSSNERGYTSKPAMDASLFGRSGAPTQASGRPSSGRPTKTDMKGLWARFSGGIRDEADTTVEPERLRDLIVRANTVPDGFNAHSKIKRLLKQRLQIAAGERPVDWAIGEQAAWASLLTEGYPVRLAGQDSGRGTFSHRHAVLTDTQSGDEHYPLQHLAEDQASFGAIDSMLSENAVLGFEFGYTLDYPEALVLWEAQFGDFANGAQVMIDQFITSSEQKWNRFTGLVMLLPHGYEGQGPEHSSARLERYLAACGQGNIQVANISTPANFFHALRRQVRRRARRPLVVMSPKSLLRHAEATSTLAELSGGSFQHIIPETDALDPAGVKRLVFCSGKVYYELRKARREADNREVALVRVEMLHPLPLEAMREQMALYPNAQVAWCQEEPRNMGAWTALLDWFVEAGEAPPKYIGRPAAASPATGSHRKHRAEQDAVIRGALEF